MGQPRQKALRRKGGRVIETRAQGHERRLPIITDEQLSEAQADAFGCVRLACVLTPRACGKRWFLVNVQKRFRDKARTNSVTIGDLDSCMYCPVGEANAEANVE